MQFLKILFWCLLAFVAAVFTFGNWTMVTIRLWGGMEALINLPLLLLVTFLLGFVPVLIYHYTVRWRLRSQIASNDRALEQTRATLDSLAHRPTPVVAAPAPRPVLAETSTSA